MVAELAELNGLSSDLPEIPVHILVSRLRIAVRSRYKVGGNSETGH